MLDAWPRETAPGSVACITRRIKWPQSMQNKGTCRVEVLVHQYSKWQKSIIILIWHNSDMWQLLPNSFLKCCTYTSSWQGWFGFASTLEYHTYCKHLCILDLPLYNAASQLAKRYGYPNLAVHWPVNIALPCIASICFLYLLMWYFFSLSLCCLTLHDLAWTSGRIMMVFNIRAKVHALGYHCNSSALTFAIHRGRVAEDTGELNGFASSNPWHHRNSLSPAVGYQSIKAVRIPRLSVLKGFHKCHDS